MKKYILSFTASLIISLMILLNLLIINNTNLIAQLKDKKIEKIIFACMVNPGESEIEIIIYAESIRKFAGKFANFPIWIFIPDKIENISKIIRKKLLSLNANIYPFTLHQDISNFPFAPKVIASAAAEKLADGKTELLIWMDPDNIFINEPNEFLLPAKKELGYRPVQHVLIGSLFDNPVDSFWNTIYHHSKVPENRVFPMTTVVDSMKIRPYFNAGHLVVRPEKYNLRSWKDNFLKLYKKKNFQCFL